jgi:hypothetical protein
MFLPHSACNPASLKLRRAFGKLHALQGLNSVRRIRNAVRTNSTGPCGRIGDNNQGTEDCATQVGMASGEEGSITYAHFMIFANAIENLCMETARNATSN